jgi:hypothetical protein
MTVLPQKRMTVDQYLAWVEGQPGRYELLEAHCLIVDPAKPRIVHHARSGDGTILTRIMSEGRIALDPPGLEFAVSEIYPE